MHDNETYRAMLSVMLTSARSVAVEDADLRFIELWLSTKTSAHTRRAYASDAARLLRAVPRKPIAQLTLADLQHWIRTGMPGLATASRNPRY